MPLSKGRRPLTCHHEAGHCLARWFFGFHVDDAEVLSVEQVRSGVTVEDRRGREIYCEGLVNGYDIHFPDLPPPSNEDEGRYKAEGERRAEIALVDMCAGMSAEARYRKRSVFLCLMEGGGRDYEQAREIANRWCRDPAVALDIAFQRAAALVASRRGKAALDSVAGQLWRRGRLLGDEIGTLCRAAYDSEEPQYDAWRQSWPPTLSQLRRGIILPPRKKAA